MRRTYLRTLILTGAIATTALPFPRANAAQGLFNSQPVPQDKFIVLARPVGRSNWALLVLQQLKTQPRCWSKRSDGLVDPSLNRFNFTGICRRYLDSNGYSLRTSGKDAEKRFRLRLRQNKNGLALQAMDSVRGGGITVARASNVRRDKNAFVKLTLEPGWSLERRSYKGRTLSHVYFANAEPLNTLLASSRAKPRDSSLTFTASLPKPPSQPFRQRRTGQRGPVRLTVIPFKP